MNRLLFTLPLVAVLVLGGCGDDATTSSTDTTAPAASLLLTADVGEAVGIIDAMANEPGTEIGVVGRVQEINRDGYAVFYLVDDSLEYCGRGKEQCGCKTPWDYCCDEETMRAARMPIELRGDDGMPLKSDDLGLRLLDLVAVKGTLEKTEEGGLVLLAQDGWYRRERPALPDGVQWPDE
jgi:hypothetical protein